MHPESACLTTFFNVSREGYMSTRYDGKEQDSASVPMRAGACIILGVVGVVGLIALIIGFGHMMGGGR